MIVLSKVTQHSIAAVCAVFSGNDAHWLPQAGVERTIKEQSPRKAGRA